MTIKRDYKDVAGGIAVIGDMATIGKKSVTHRLAEVAVESIDADEFEKLFVTHTISTILGDEIESMQQQGRETGEVDLESIEGINNFVGSFVCIK